MVNIFFLRKIGAAAGLGTGAFWSGAGGNELNNMKNALALRYHHVYDVGTINQPHASAKRQRRLRGPWRMGVREESADQGEP